MRQVAFTTLGCKVNQFETEVMEGLFKAQGYKVVNFDEQADVYVVNTCSVTNLGEKSHASSFEGLIGLTLRLLLPSLVATPKFRPNKWLK